MLELKYNRYIKIDNNIKLQDYFGFELDNLYIDIKESKAGFFANGLRETNNGYISFEYFNYIDNDNIYYKNTALHFNVNDYINNL